MGTVYGHCTGTVRALYGHCTGTVKTKAKTNSTPHRIILHPFIFTQAVIHHRVITLYLIPRHLHPFGGPCGTIILGTEIYQRLRALELWGSILLASGSRRRRRRRRKRRRRRRRKKIVVSVFLF